MMFRTPVIGALCAPAIALLMCTPTVRADERDYHCEVIYPVDGKPRFVVTMFPEAPDGGGGIAGAVLYRNDIITNAYYNPGDAPNGPANYIIFDDVPIPTNELNGATSVAVTKVTFGIARQPPGTPTNVSAYWTTLSGGPSNINNALDQPVHSIGTVALGAPIGGSSITQLISFGNGASPIFTAPLNPNIITGPGGQAFSSFLLGLQFSNTSTANGWRVTAGPDANVDMFWRLNPNTFAENTVTFSNGPVGTFYLIVEGSPVPFEPCPDINGDSEVDVNDLLLLIGAWGTSYPPADLNDDGTVDVNDLLLLIGGWGSDCGP